jgi:archaemetzincin
MNLVELLPIGNVERTLLQSLQASLPLLLKVRCEISPALLDPEVAFHPERQQYYSSEILQRMQVFTGKQWRLLGVADVDLYIPILKYVFGEAQMGGLVPWFLLIACARNSMASKPITSC